jgi:hypothetical protein
MWTPIWLTPPLTLAGIAGVFSPKAARTVLPLFGALYALDGVIGIYTHLRGIEKRPGGLRETHYNLVMGPPLLAPGSLAMVGTMGVVAAIVKREK